MIILGIDPGLADVGYGIIETAGPRLERIGSGVIVTDKNLPTPDRLQEIFTRISDLIEQFRPDLLTVEALFFSDNKRSALMVAEARGVILLAAAMNCLPISEYTPLQIKLMIAGHGRAPKAKVREEVIALLELPFVPVFDESDALAIAICAARGVHTPERDPFYLAGNQASAS